MQDSTVNYCEPHDRVCRAKSAPQRVATGTNVAVFIFRSGRSPSHGWAVFPNDNGAYRVLAPHRSSEEKILFAPVGDRKSLPPWKRYSSELDLEK